MNSSYSRPLSPPLPQPAGWIAWGIVNGPPPTVIEAVDEGVRFVDGDRLWDMAKHHKLQSGAPEDLLQAVAARHSQRPTNAVLSRLGLPSSQRWQEAVSTALLGPWATPLDQSGYLPCSALKDLRAEIRTLHRQLTPIWLRRTRHGRVLSLDAPLGHGLSLYDLVAFDADLLTHVAGGVSENERIEAVLHALTPNERQVVYAYAEGLGATWTESAAAANAADPEAFGERVRRKVKRLAAEQARRKARRWVERLPETE